MNAAIVIGDYSDALAPQVQVFTPDKAPCITLHDDEPVFG